MDPREWVGKLDWSGDKSEHRARLPTAQKAKHWQLEFAAK